MYCEKMKATLAEDRTTAFSSTAASRTSLSLAGADKKDEETFVDVECGKEDAEVQKVPEQPFPEGGLQGWATLVGA